jgi:hypothetical protein
VRHSRLSSSPLRKARTDTDRQTDRQTGRQTHTHTTHTPHRHSLLNVQPQNPHGLWPPLPLPMMVLFTPLLACHAYCLCLCPVVMQFGRGGSMGGRPKEGKARAMVVTVWSRWALLSQHTSPSIVCPCPCGSLLARMLSLAHCFTAFRSAVAQRSSCGTGPFCLHAGSVTCSSHTHTHTLPLPPHARTIFSAGGPDLHYWSSVHHHGRDVD